eukprot:NODE_6707_length_853_cov_29.639726_g6109_i0.p1 GENE.NODE_6707_length_853_cov_29.639726_g6109_i0~~NODE_6707_length_853_cov_29.639726_g6109_i0.p1  ORF type:complete len:111 (+),score=31.78 NODE_6707_length_853_cov_29.639726_g6109_i0:168-500(+)
MLKPPHQRVLVTDSKSLAARKAMTPFRPLTGSAIEPVNWYELRMLKRPNTPSPATSPTKSSSTPASPVVNPPTAYPVIAPTPVQSKVDSLIAAVSPDPAKKMEILTSNIF